MKGATRTFLVAFLVLVGVAAGLRLWGIEAGLPHLMTRPDEEVLLSKTGLPARGTLDLEYHVRHPGVPSAYIFLLWGVGELGLPAMQALDLAPPGDYLRALERFPARLLLLERLFSVLVGVGTVAVLTLLVRREMGDATALAAGALLATCFLHVRESHSAKPDVALAFWVIVALGALARVARGATTRRAILAGAAIGLGMAMKPPAVLLFAPAWLAAVLGSEASGWRRIVPRSLIVMGLVATATFVATSPDLVFNPETRRQIINIVYIVFPALDPNPRPAPVAASIVAADTARSLFAGHRYYYGFALRHGAGGLAMAAAPLAVAWGFVSGAPLAILGATFTVVAFAVFGASPAMLARYLVPVLPALAVLLAGASAAAVRRWIPARRQGVVFALVIAALAVEPLGDSIAYDRILARTDTRLQATEWLRSHVPAGSVVAMAGTVFWGWGEPWMPPDVRRVLTGLDPAKIDEVHARYLVTHDHSLFSSTVDPAALERLAPRLALRAEFDPFLGPRERARFDPQDAYYVPLDGLDAVARPGPVVRIYEVGPPGPAPRRR